MGPTHVAPLTRLFERNEPDAGLFDPFPLTAQTAQRIANRRGVDRYFGAERGQDLLGMTMLRGWDEGFAVPSFGILIDREQRGRGLGAAMTETTIEEARRLGASAVRLSVYTANETALGLYQRLGFIETERASTARGEKVIMRLEL
jgi:ribosomal protein S18 acetylase RimI-like enzyme